MFRGICEGESGCFGKDRMSGTGRAGERARARATLGGGGGACLSFLRRCTAPSLRARSRSSKGAKERRAYSGRIATDGVLSWRSHRERGRATLAPACHDKNQREREKLIASDGRGTRRRAQGDEARHQALTRATTWPPSAKRAQKRKTHGSSSSFDVFFKNVFFAIVLPRFSGLG